MYFAIIGDIKGSRKLKNRGDFQKKLGNILEKINQSYGEDMAADFTITLGDEFQGLMTGGDHVLDVILQIKAAVLPEGIRFGVGIGEMSTAIIPSMALGADGPAYYMARRAIEYAKETERRNKWAETDMVMECEGGGRDIEVLNQMLCLMYSMESMWSEKQKRTIWDMLLHRDGQKKAAERMGVSQPAINKALSSGKYYAYERAYDIMKERMGKLGEGNV